MSLTGEEIRSRLSAFAAKWSVYDGSERSEAQTFLNQLFECYGSDRPAVAWFEHHQAGGFLDLIWPRVCLIEMKAPSEAKRLRRHWPQAESYWRSAADPARNVPAPKWVVLCAFRRLEIWQPGEYPNAPRLELDLVDLPDQYDALLFLAGREPVFSGGQAKLTLDAVSHLVAIYQSLRERRAAEPDVLRDFLLQSVWCLFAEDLGQIPEHRFTGILDGLIEDPRRSSADELGQLFTYLNTPGGAPDHGLYAGTPYANGGLFETAARVHLDRDELLAFRLAAQFNWKEVQPSIFGSLLEGGLGHDQQWRLGAHYTHEADIQKVVQPTIVGPWRERIGNLERHRDAERAQYDLLNYVVLDPACGSGNFLYVAYRELRRIEQELKEREQELRRAEGRPERQSLDFFPLTNIKGIEIESFAVALARVTLWMGHKLAVDELQLAESTLPLGDLSGIQIGDALRIDWPRADAIIGNPPFHGSQHLRSRLGDGYVEWLKREYGVGVKDFCVYWFRRTHDHLADGNRAGLVGTNSVSQNKARGASLDYIVEHGGTITQAVSSQPWPGEAKVHVSIVNWIKGAVPSETRLLDGREVSGITSALRVGGARPTPARLGLNKDRAFQGPIPAGEGFVVEEHLAAALLSSLDADYSVVVKPYLMGDDIVNEPLSRPTRWIIDFGVMPLEVAERWPKAMELVRERVRPARLRNRDKGFRERWWQFGRPRPKLRAALHDFQTFLVANRVGKRLHIARAEASWCLGDKVVAFALDDTFAFGVLACRLHSAWAWEFSSTLKADLNYTPTTAFETFPWPPNPGARERARVGEVADALVALRSAICEQDDFGLTQLYNAMEDGAYKELAALHRHLDEAVAAAYGLPSRIAQEGAETNRRLLELNQEIAAGRVAYSPFAYLR